MFDIQKFITNHIKKGTLKNLSSETKSSKYLYMTLVCLLVYTMNKYKKNNSSHISNNCHSCGSPVNKCSCSCSSSDPAPPFLTLLFRSFLLDSSFGSSSITSTASNTIP